MKNIIRTSATLFFSALFLAAASPKAMADCLTKDCPTEKKGTSLAITHENDSLLKDEFDFDFEDPFIFSDRFISVNIYNANDELIFSKECSREEAQKDEKLQTLLKNSEFLLSIDDQHFYFAEKRKP